MTDDQIKADLIHLAMERTFKAVGSVLQLTDDPATKYSILVSLAANAADAAAAVLVGEDRAHSRNDAYAVIFKEMLEAFGVDWRRKGQR